MSQTSNRISGTTLLRNIDNAREAESQLQKIGPVGRMAAHVVENTTRAYVRTVTGSDAFVDNVDRARKAQAILSATVPVTGRLAATAVEAGLRTYVSGVSFRRPTVQ